MTHITNIRLQRIHPFDNPLCVFDYIVLSGNPIVPIRNEYRALFFLSFLCEIWKIMALHKFEYMPTIAKSSIQSSNCSIWVWRSFPILAGYQQSDGFSFHFRLYVYFLIKNSNYKLTEPIQCQPNELNLRRFKNNCVIPWLFSQVYALWRTFRLL